MGRLASRGMASLDAQAALKNLADAGERARWPRGESARRVGSTLRPELRPSFQLDRGSSVFTIGSCFARNIEKHLWRAGYKIPTWEFEAPAGEIPRGGAVRLLNEYNPGTIGQRIERAYSGDPQPDDTLVETEDGWVDLLLSGSLPVSRERGRERRREIDDIYRALPVADVVIVTLGLTEAWLDTATGTYLNCMPPKELLTGDRYRLELMDVTDAWPLLEAAFALLKDNGQRAIVTVSPVPFAASFSGDDAIVANAFSKAVLRVCAQRLAAWPNVDYLPAYETVTWGGLTSFQDDNLHVEDEAVGAIVDWVTASYAAK